MDGGSALFRFSKKENESRPRRFTHRRRSADLNRSYASDSCDETLCVRPIPRSSAGRSCSPCGPGRRYDLPGLSASTRLARSRNRSRLCSCCRWYPSCGPCLRTSSPYCRSIDRGRYNDPLCLPKYSKFCEPCKPWTPCMPCNPCKPLSSFYKTCLKKPDCFACDNFKSVSYPKGTCRQRCSSPKMNLSDLDLPCDPCKPKTPCYPCTRRLCSPSRRYDKLTCNTSCKRVCRDPPLACPDVGDCVDRCVPHMCPWEADITINGTVKGHCTSTTDAVANKLTGCFKASGTRYCTDPEKYVPKRSGRPQRMVLGRLDDGCNLDFSKNNRVHPKGSPFKGDNLSLRQERNRSYERSSPQRQAGLTDSSDLDEDLVFERYHEYSSGAEESDYIRNRQRGTRRKAKVSIDPCSRAFSPSKMKSYPQSSTRGDEGYDAEDSSSWEDCSTKHSPRTRKARSHREVSPPQGHRGDVNKIRLSLSPCSNTLRTYLPKFGAFSEDDWAMGKHNVSGKDAESTSFHTSNRRKIHTAR